MDSLDPEPLELLCKQPHYALHRAGEDMIPQEVQIIRIGIDRFLGWVRTRRSGEYFAWSSGVWVRACEVITQPALLL